MAGSNTPLVSVITPFYNGAAWLREAIESVLVQTYTHWQLILVDDGSADEASAVAKSYCNKFPDRILYLEHPGHVNKGVAASRNLGLTRVSGNLVAFLDSDDCWLPGKLEEQVSLLGAHPHAGALCTASKYWFSWSDTNLDDHIVHVGAKTGNLYAPPALMFRLYPLGKGAAPCPSGMIMRKEAVDRIGGFEEYFKGENQVYEDQAFLCKIYLQETVLVSDSANNLYRQRPGSLMQSIGRKNQYLKVRLYFLKWMKQYLTHLQTKGYKIRMLLLIVRLHTMKARLGIFARSFFVKAASVSGDKKNSG